MQYLFARSKSNNSFWFTLYFNCICVEGDGGCLWVGLAREQHLSLRDYWAGWSQSSPSIILPNILQADCQFLKMDLDRDGVVSKQEFVHYCCNDSTVLQSMCVLPWKLNILNLLTALARMCHRGFWQGHGPYNPDPHPCYDLFQYYPVTSLILICIFYGICQTQWYLELPLLARNKFKNKIPSYHSCITNWFSTLLSLKAWMFSEKFWRKTHYVHLMFRLEQKLSQQAFLFFQFLHPEMKRFCFTRIEPFSARIW